MERISIWLGVIVGAGLAVVALSCWAEESLEERFDQAREAVKTVDLADEKRMCVAATNAIASLEEIVVETSNGVSNPVMRAYAADLGDETAIAVLKEVKIDMLRARGGGARPGEEQPKIWEIKNERAEFVFDRVEGKSELPLQYMRTKTNKDYVTPTRLDAYWLLHGPVTRRQFAAVMGKSVNGDPEEPVDGVAWLTAYEFCERFNKKYADRLPKGYLLQLPTMIEWAHAQRVLPKTISGPDPVGCLLFTGDGLGGFLRTFSDGEIEVDKQGPSAVTNDVAIDYIRVPMRATRPHSGFRPVLSPVVGGEDEDDSGMVTRGIVLTQHGLFAAAKRVLECALSESQLSKKQRARAKDCLRYLNQKHNDDLATWSDLVTLIGQFASRYGFATEPYLRGWQSIDGGTSEDVQIAGAYETNGISGVWMRIEDLPSETRRWQSVGEKQMMLIKLGKKFHDGSYAITTNTLVQVLKCDFTGDGRKDLVVERFGHVGSGGYWYDFFGQRPDGSYTNLLSLQTVGLCAVPSANGGACAFLTLSKVSNPVLKAKLITLRDGEVKPVQANTRPFALLDAREDAIYTAACGEGLPYQGSFRLVFCREWRTVGRV